MFQIEIGQRNGRKCSVAYYPLTGHSVSSQIHTAPDSMSSCTTFKPEVNPLCVAEAEEQAPAVPKASTVVPQVGAGRLHFPLQRNVPNFVP